MTQVSPSIADALAAAAAADEALRAQPETELLQALLDRLRGDALKAEMDAVIRLAGACPPTQVLQTATALVSTWNGCAAQAEIRLATVLQLEAEAQAQAGDTQSAVAAAVVRANA
jgi:hypothetical protein